MSTTPATRRTSTGVDWFNRLLAIGATVVTGVVLGMQYVNPHKRVLAVLAALIVLGIAWRVNMITGLGMLVVALPYPRGTVFGNTNLALILLLLMIWLLRMTQGHAARPVRTPVDIPVVGLIICYIWSFYNIESMFALNRALQNTTLFIACVLMFYLIVNSVKSSAQLYRLHLFQCVSLFSVLLLSLYELNHPNGVLIPGWIVFGNRSGEMFDTTNVRIGGPFFDYELLSEYSAILLLLVGFMLLRSRTLLARIALGGLFTGAFFMLFATVTRGALVALGAGVIYLLWILRRRLQIVPLTIAASATVVAFVSMNFFVANFTRSGDLFARLGGTEFVGFIPDTRATAWSHAWERFLEHPIIGHGPYYATVRGLELVFWPHNVYLYIANLIGIIGLAFFLWLLWKLWRSSQPKNPDLLRDDYARAFLTIAHVQLVVFLINEMKIDYLRNTIYQFQVWLLFANIIAAHLVVAKQKAFQQHKATHAP